MARHEGEHRGQDESGLPAGQVPGPIRCHCGAVLADRVDGRVVVIDGVEYQFRRKSDRLTCPQCFFEHPRRSLRPSVAPDPEDSGERRRHDDPPG
jgi:hypothetical protein